MGKSVSRKKTVAAHAAGDEESARGRLLSAATHLFCKNGINATGIDAIIDEAGTAKTTLYKLFGSKTNLVHAVLETEGKAWRERLIGAIEAGGGDPQTKLARIFPALKSWYGGACRGLAVRTVQGKEAEATWQRSRAITGGVNRLYGGQSHQVARMRAR